VRPGSPPTLAPDGRVGTAPEIRTSGDAPAVAAPEDGTVPPASEDGSVTSRPVTRRQAEAIDTHRIDGRDQGHRKDLGRGRRRR
jgi:hypothetical protein